MENSAAVKTEVISSPERVQQLEPGWRALEQASAGVNLFQSYDWCCHIFCALGARGDIRLQPVVVAAWQNDVLAGVLPLMIERSLGVRFLVHLAEPLSQYADVLAHPSYPAAIDAMIRHACSLDGIDVLMLRRVREDSPFVPHLNKAGAMPLNPASACDVDLSRFSRFEDYARTVSAKAQKDRRRIQRRMEEKGRLSFEHVRDGDAVLLYLQQALDWKREWLTAKGLLSSVFTNKTWLDILVSLVRGGKSGIFLTVLKVNEIPIAIEVGFCHGPRLYAYIGSVHPEYLNLSAVKLAMEETIRLCLDQKIKIFDLLSPADAYKSNWTDRRTEVNDFIIPLTVKGQVYSVLFQKWLRPKIKLFYHRVWVLLPSWIRK